MTPRSRRQAAQPPPTTPSTSQPQSFHTPTGNRRTRSNYNSTPSPNGSFTTPVRPPTQDQRSTPGSGGSTSRQLRGPPPMTNPQLTLKRTSGGSGSFSLSELSPGSRTPAPKKHPSDPFLHSPAGRQDAQFYIPSPHKGFTPRTIPPPGSVGSRDQPSVGSLVSNALFDSTSDVFGQAEINRGQATVECLRTWRTDANHQHLYGAAAYWGDKVLSLTGRAATPFF